MFAKVERDARRVEAGRKYETTLSKHLAYEEKCEKEQSMRRTNDAMSQ